MPARSKAGRYDWDEGFGFYASLGQTRSLQAVADELGAPKRSVERAARKWRWAERAREIDEQARQEADKRLIRERADRVEDTLRIIDAARLRFASDLKSGRARLTGSDFVGLMKLEALLEGQATDVIHVEEVRTFMLAVYVAAEEYVPPERQDEFIACIERAAGLDPIPVPTNDWPAEIDA